MHPTRRLCNAQEVIEQHGWDDVVEWVNMDVDDKCMDMETISWKVSDATAWEILSELSETASVEEFKQLSQDWQYRYICQLIDRGASLLQASRLTSLTYTYLYRRMKREAKVQNGVTPFCMDILSNGDLLISNTEGTTTVMFQMPY